MKRCPFCAEEIQDEAIKCRHCGSSLVGGAPQAVAPSFANPVILPPPAIPSPVTSDMKGVSVGPRALAVVIDAVVMSPVLFLILKNFGQGETTTGPSGTSFYYNLSLTGAFLVFLATAAYCTILEGAFGSTVGKFVVGIKVLREDGSKPGWGPVLTRNLLRIVDGLFFYLVAAVAVWSSPTRQRVGDRVAHTSVVSRSVQPVETDRDPFSAFSDDSWQ